MRIIPAFALVAVLTVIAAPAPATERDDLFDALKNAPTEAAGRTAEHAIWEYWMAAGPTEEVRARLRDAIRAIHGYEIERALGLLDRIVADAPDYAEGWNQRAFAHFLGGSLDESLEDIDRTLELEPKHFGALSGKAMVLMQQGRAQLSQNALRDAVEIHPWLKERSLLLPAPGDKPAPDDGEEI
ncbi:MAG: hypothetical protein JJ913_04330 [Rhizobiaceae bacterium]|nr:hypothetical protein [Rhizobiaceae bacterium]